MFQKLSAQPMQSQKALHTITGVLIVAGLYASSLYSYLLFHSLVELFCILTAFVIFVLAWHTRYIQDNRYLLFIGIASLFVGAIELLHVFAYKGMGVFAGYSADLPTQLWIAFRYLFSLSFLAAPFFIKGKLPAGKIFVTYLVVTIVLVVSIFSGWFPSCFVEGSGLTLFKIYSEYVISLIFLAALGLLIMNRGSFDRSVLRLMVGALLASIVSELSFTRYVSVYGMANMVGHFFLLASMVVIYRALVITGIVEPSTLLFRDLKKSEEAMRAGEERLRLFIEHAPAAMAMFDREMRYMSASRRWVRDYGLGDRHLAGLSHYEVFPEIPEQWREFHRRGLAGEVVKSDDDRFGRADGTVQWLRWEIRPWRDAAGAVAGIIIFTEDITERKESEEKIRNLNNELQSNVQQLEAANRELETFAYSVSHDLRAPLRAIDGFSHAIEEELGEKLGDTVKDKIRRVRAGVGNMGRLIDALLNLSRLSRCELNCVTFDLSELVREKAQELMLTEPGRGVEFVAVPGITAHGDPLMLGAVIENLLGNAWKFTAKREDARVEFGVMSREFGDKNTKASDSQLPTPNSELVYFVRDNGAGFDITYASKLFSPFQRLHSSQEFPGLGIGLATVDRIINRHGGKIWAEGAVGKGATFFFTL
jgi:PAS domain S-box-containing protein